MIVSALMAIWRLSNLIKAIVFDLDDTLISEHEYIKSGYKHISQTLSKKINIDEKKIYNDLTLIFKENPKRVFNKLFDKYKIDYTMDTIKRLVDEYRGHMPDIRLYNDVIPCITTLKENNMKIGLITDGYSITQKNKINSLEIEHLFDYIIVTDDYGRDFWKPSPKPFELMKNQLDVEYDEMIYVGDNPEKDFFIQKIHPLYTVRVKRKNNVYNEADYLEGIKENKTIYNLNEIFEFINTI